MIRIYLESSALWAMYNGQPGEALVKHVLQDATYNSTTSVWSYLELYRSIQKRFNQNEITLPVAINLRDFIDATMKQQEYQGMLKICAIEQSMIEKAKGLIVDVNLYSADALHLAVALITGCSHFMADDFHFSRLKNSIPAKYPITILPIENFDISSLPKPT